MQLVEDAPVANSQPVAIPSLKLGHVVVTGVRIGGDSFDLLQNPLLPVHRKPGKSFGKGFCSDDLVHQSIVTIIKNNSHPKNKTPPLFSSHFSCTALTDTPIAIVKQSPESAASRTASVSRDGTQLPPQNHFRRLFDNMQTSSKSGDPAPRKVHAKLQKTPLSPYSCRGWN